MPETGSTERHRRKWVSTIEDRLLDHSSRRDNEDKNSTELGIAGIGRHFGE